MKIEFSENEIKQALTDYVEAQGISLKDKQITVQLTAGRGSNGHTASIEINNDKVSEPTQTELDTTLTKEVEEVTEDTPIFA